ncbi:MAG TPA: hypothetical protein VFT29_20685 [Gemmatimonadaceae bacterium]|nr:hypothetical protein [Gemmatimonadaceae bacterium]
MRRMLGVACGGVAWWLVSCRDIPAPVGGVLSVSQIILPLPGVVFQDTMRDSLGVVAPLNFIAFGPTNDTVNAEKSFIVLDTGAHMGGAGGAFLVADSFNLTVRVVGSVEAVQTQPASVILTQSPDTLVAADSTEQHRTYTLASGDTVVNADLKTLVRHRPDAGVAAVIVKYVIEQAPAGVLNKGPAVVLVNGNVLSSRDTTDANGIASLAARLRLAALPPPLATDTAVVSANASYKGRSIGRVVFTVIYTKQ